MDVLCDYLKGLGGCLEGGDCSTRIYVSFVCNRILLNTLDLTFLTGIDDFPILDREFDNRAGVLGEHVGVVVLRRNGSKPLFKPNVLKRYG